MCEGNLGAGGPAGVCLAGGRCFHATCQHLEASLPKKGPGGVAPGKESLPAGILEAR